MVGSAVGLATVSCTAVDTLELLCASPAYKAVRLCTPAASVEVTSCAVVPLNAALPTLTAASKKVTVPVGALPVIVAVSVTGLPTLTGFGLRASAVVVSFVSLILVTKAFVMMLDRGTV